MTDTSQCIHYWIIEPHTAPESKGVCKKCGATRMFRNSEFLNRKDANAYNVRHQIKTKITD